MSQFPLPEDHSQQPDANLPDKRAAEGSNSFAVHGSVGGSAYNLQGDNNRVIQGSNNLTIFIDAPIQSQRVTPIGNSARPEIQRLLLARVKNEVASRLKQSLHNGVLLNLEKQEQLYQVYRSWDTEVKIGQKPGASVSSNTRIIDVFDQEEIAGKLLILGNPGAGKTTALLTLAQDLIVRALEDPTYPVPVIFTLSAWEDGQQPIAEWLVAQLKFKYGVSVKLGQAWVKDHKLLPLLDGLDELDAARQEVCVQAINYFLQPETQPHSLIVCSRSEEYNNYKTKLQLNGAISLQPLTDAQIFKYLTNVNQTSLWSPISDNLNLLELIRTPLLLSITILAFQEISIEQWQQITSPKDRLQYLLDAYVRRMLTREMISRSYANNKQPSPQQTKLWLTWLARKLDEQNRTEFFIEALQPSFLESQKRKRAYVVIFGLLISLTTCFLAELFSAGSGWLLGWLFGQAPFGLVVGLMGGVLMVVLLVVILLGVVWINRSSAEVGKALTKASEAEIKTHEVLHFSMEQLISILLPTSTTKLITELMEVTHEVLATGFGGLFLGVVIGWFRKDLLGGVNVGLKAALILGLLRLSVEIMLFLGEGLVSSDIETKTIPNQGIWKSLQNSLSVGLMGILFGGVLGGLALSLLDLSFGLGLDLTAKFVGEGIVGLTIGVLMCLGNGGIACIQHFSLRCILYSDKHIPWNYAQFLDYATERVFLQRVGGGYRFIHKYLEEYFADQHH